MPRSSRTLLVPLLLVAIPTLLAFLWGLSWAAGDFPECGQGTYFLADFGWLLGGLLLGIVVGIVVPIILAKRRSFLLAIPVLAVVGLGMLVAGNAGASIAAKQVGCDAWNTADAGEMAIIGLAIGAVPTVLVVGVVVGIGWLMRSPPS